MDVLSFLCYCCASAVELSLLMEMNSVSIESNVPILNTVFISLDFLLEISLLSTMFGI